MEKALSLLLLMAVWHQCVSSKSTHSDTVGSAFDTIKITSQNIIGQVRRKEWDKATGSGNGTNVKNKVHCSAICLSSYNCAAFHYDVKTRRCDMLMSPDGKTMKCLFAESERHMLTLHINLLHVLASAEAATATITDIAYTTTTTSTTTTTTTTSTATTISPPAAAPISTPMITATFSPTAATKTESPKPECFDHKDCLNCFDDPNCHWSDQGCERVSQNIKPRAARLSRLLCRMQIATDIEDLIPITKELQDIKPCDYFIDTVNAYCERTATVFDQLKPKTQKIMFDVMKCLIISLVPLVPKLDSVSCKEITALGVSGQVACFLSNGFCENVSITNSIATGDFEDSMVLLKIVDSADIMSGMYTKIAGACGSRRFEEMFESYSFDWLG